MHYVYLISNETGGLYYGCTGDLKKRIEEHNKGRAGYTKGSIWKLIYYEAYISKEDAFNREKKLKHHGQGLNKLKIRLKNTLSSHNLGRDEKKADL